ncbi:MAG: hypothetical protein LLF98_07990 [Clostridium sp.]|uniref:hypothetical protein n=1 Tax=Clostridium sp. TaxID=1506 RepID=UPI0025B908CB|nr:hypothetical protein [Clostridium sp.]MCE5221196.1 hypothetical protein [Clostridium sp.]
MDIESRIKESTEILKNVFCLSIASKEMMYKDIDEIYNKNKHLYLQAYRDSASYNTILNKGLSYKTEIYVKKMIGISEDSIKQDDTTNIINLYKKAYRKIYNNTKNLDSIKILDIIKFVDATNSESSIDALSAFYFYSIRGLLEPFNIADYKFDAMLDDVHVLALYKKINFSYKIIEHKKEDIIKLKNNFGIKNKDYIADDLITDILNKEISMYIKNNPNSNELDASSIVQKSGKIAKNIGLMEGLYKCLELNATGISKKISFTSREISEILLSYKLTKNFDDYADEESLNPYIISAIYMAILNKEYKNLRADYSKYVSEESIIEIHNLQEKLKNSVNEVDKLKADFEIKEKTLTDKEQSLLKEIELLKKENSLLKKNINDTKALKTEVIKLREFVFNLQNTIEDEIAVTEELDLSTIKDKNIVIIGGTTSWTKKLKELFPKWQFIGVEQKNNNLSFINNCDFLFININMTHSLYFKIKSLIEKYNIKYNFLKNTNNINNTLHEIVSNLKD